MNVGIKGVLPKKSNSRAACYDLYANEDVCLQPGKTQAVSTGTHLDMTAAPYLNAEIRPRSGLSIYGVIAILGTIDNDYTGDIKVILYNTTEQEYTVSRGDRIAQLGFLWLPDIQLVPVDTLPITERGSDGFGSTGK